MKEATGELNMTVITIVAITAIGGIMALMWGPIQNWISGSFGGAAGSAGYCPSGTFNATTGRCDG